MKRNHPPDSSWSPYVLEKERAIIDQRLDELYSNCKIRKVPRLNVASYCDKNHHVSLNRDSNSHHFDVLARYSKELGYRYLDPLAALYLLESRHLIIYYNDLPLSLAEAYHLMIRNLQEFQDYKVFSQLNHDGYFCLRPSLTNASAIQQEVGHIDETPHIVRVTSCQQETKPLFKIESCTQSFNSILDRLRASGPQQLKPGDLRAQQSQSIAISFHAYKREYFTKNKPRKGLLGKPDYLVVIKDKNKTNSLNCIEFMSLANDDVCNKLLFAIIDADSSLSFVHYKPMDPFNELNINIDESPRRMKPDPGPECGCDGTSKSTNMPSG